jgi:hypothetical protein
VVENQLMPALKNPSLVAINQTLPSRTRMQNNQTFTFARWYFWGIRPIIRKPHKVCAVILVNPYFIQVHDIIPCSCKSNRPKERTKMLDNCDHCVIKRTIHGLYSRKIAPTVSIIHKEIKDLIKKTHPKL